MNLNFYKISRKYYEEVLDIYRYYYLNVKKLGDKRYLSNKQKEGFPVGEPLTFNETIGAEFCEVAISNDRVVGFVRADKMTSQMCNDKFTLQWIGTPKQWKMFISEKGLELGLILVHPDFKGVGIARELLKRLVDFMKKQRVGYLFSWVVTNPKNKPSLKFHDKSGFIHIATYDVDKAWGIPNYQSKLFFKEIK